LSWYLNHKRKSHGLDSFFEDYGIAKPKIDDWENLTLEEYRHRCCEDVKINKALWEDFKGRLIDLYSRSKEAIDDGLVGGKRVHPSEEIYLDSLIGKSLDEHVDRILTFLMFKMDCARLQEKTKWTIDVEMLDRGISELSEHIETAKEELGSVMPKVPKYSKKCAPKKPYKMNGELSASGKSWEEVKEKLDTEAEDGLGNPLVVRVSEDEVKVLKSYEEPNVNSSVQIKDFLYSKGWIPENFEFKRDEEAFQRWIDSRPVKGSSPKAWDRWKKRKPEDRKVPQVSIKGDDGKELCPSVVRLAEDVPEIMAYSKYTTVKHRLDMLKGFKKILKEGDKIEATFGGFTNTLRVQHRNFVNLPGVDKPYGELVRGIFCARDGLISMGSDLSGLEDRTKHHFMLAHDPDYVKTMMEDDYDAHITMALSAGMITKGEFDEFMSGVKKDHVVAARKKGKTTNYASVYGGSPPAIARAAEVPIKEAEKLYEGYWKLNWSVKAIADEQYVFKDSFDDSWLVNPINGFCYSLRKDSDRFSTLAQGTGSFFFDCWVDGIQRRFQERFNTKSLNGQSHDEVIIILKDTKPMREAVENIVNESLEEVNETYNLRRKLGCDVQFGKRYSEIH